MSEIVSHREPVEASAKCFTYRCPTSGEIECLEHSGFDTCCADPACPAYGRFRGGDTATDRLQRLLARLDEREPSTLVSVRRIRSWLVEP